MVMTISIFDALRSLHYERRARILTMVILYFNVSTTGDYFDVYGS